MAGSGLVRADRDAVVDGTDAPTVSVILIFLDAEAFLVEAIESVFGQTLTAWELLLVDDGSHDGRAAIVRDYAARHPGKIRYLDHPGHANLGMSAARNLGLAAARGTYVAFLDADDVYLPQRLERHVRILDRQPTVAMVQSDLIFWYSWKNAGEEDRVRPFLSEEDRILPPPLGVTLLLAVPFYSPGICSITVRRATALAVHGFEPRFRAMYEDQVFVAKICLESAVYVLRDYLARYRRHDASYVRRMKDAGVYADGFANPSTCAFHEWLAAYVEERGTGDPVLQELIDAKLSRTEVSQPRRVAAVAQARRFLASALPRVVYRGVLRWYWSRQVREARQQYRELMLRMRSGASRQGAVTP